MLGRLLFLLLIIGGLVAYFPDSRAVALDLIQPVLRPGYTWMTRQELRQMARDLDIFLEGQGNTPLRRGEFDGWLDERYPQEQSRVDSWGTRYRAEITRSEIRVSSAGPDRSFDTEDDLSWEESRD